MSALPQPEDLVLVALLPKPRDLAIARTLGWYRIPLATAPRILAVDWLAFYQPRTFGPRKWRIEVVAPVLGHELVRRRDLFTDEPNHPRAHEEYVKLQLGPLVTLPQPILARRWKRIVFFYTTGERLLTARTIDELRPSEAERRALWHALRERGRRQAAYHVQPLPEVPDEVWLALLGLWAGSRATDGAQGSS